jgi:hypothetical protein
MARYASAHLDEIDHLDDAGATYQPVRHRLGVTAFGVTAWTADDPGDVVVNAHDGDDPTEDQELFLVLHGHAVFEVDGDRVDAPAGTFVVVQPGTPRTATALAPGTTVLAVEGTPGKPYEARGWELWAPLAPRYAAGEHAEVADRLAALVEDHPQYPMLFFNLACCESRCGRTSEAVEHLRQAVEMAEEFRESARTDADLDALREHPGFGELIAGSPPAEIPG